MINHVRRALTQGADLLGAEERGRIDSALRDLSEARQGTDRDLIRERTVALNRATERLAEALDGQGAQGCARLEAGRDDSGAEVMATHKVTFLPMNVTVDVDDEKYPLADHGRPGSLLDIALAHDIHLEHNCGGSCACTTCHVDRARRGGQPVGHGAG